MALCWKLKLNALNCIKSVMFHICNFERWVAFLICLILQTKCRVVTVTLHSAASLYWYKIVRTYSASTKSRGGRHMHICTIQILQKTTSHFIVTNEKTTLHLHKRKNEHRLCGFKWLHHLHNSLSSAQAISLPEGAVYFTIIHCCHYCYWLP